MKQRDKISMAEGSASKKEHGGRMCEEKGRWCLWSMGVSEFVCVSAWVCEHAWKTEKVTGEGMTIWLFFSNSEKNRNLTATENCGHSLQLELAFYQKTWIWLNWYILVEKWNFQWNFILKKCRWGVRSGRYNFGFLLKMALLALKVVLQYEILFEIYQQT